MTLPVSLTFLLNIGSADIVGPALGLLIGGLAAAPFGAITARRLPVKTMLILVSVVLTATSLFAFGKTLLYADAPLARGMFVAIELSSVRPVALTHLASRTHDPPISPLADHFAHEKARQLVEMAGF